MVRANHIPYAFLPLLGCFLSRVALEDMGLHEGVLGPCRLALLTRANHLRSVP